MFVIPTECPSCGSVLHDDGVSLWCVSSSCPAQQNGLVTHFFKTMDIKGVGPVAASKLDASVPQILAFTEEQFVTALGKANGSKLFTAIQNAKNSPHDGAKILAALSIPSVGQNTAKKLAKTLEVTDSLAILNISEETLLAAGITPASREKILNWFYTDYLEIWGGNLPLQPRLASEQPTRSVNGPTVCVTGKLEGFTRDSIGTYLTDKYGCKVVSSVTKNVDYLICQTVSNSSSFVKAQSLGIPILNLNQLEELLK